MHELLTTLLGMEKEARQAAYVADDNTFYAQTEIERRVAQIQREAQTRITNIEREFINEENVQINKIKLEYQHKTATMEAFFAHKRDDLVEKIKQMVLHGH